MDTATILPSRLKGIFNLLDFEDAARRHLPRPIFGYIAGAAESGSTTLRNRQDFGRYEFVPRVLVGVSRRSCTVRLFGQDYDAPVGIAPMGICALSAYRGDIVMARAAAAANVPMILSSSSLIPLEDVIRTNPAVWFQAYLAGDERSSAAMLERAQAAGYHTLVLTVDTPTAPNHENYRRAGFESPLRPSLRLALDGLVRPRWLFGTFLRTLIKHGIPHFENNHADRGPPILSPSLSRNFVDGSLLDWAHVARMRRQWSGRLVLKGILGPADAARAVDCGADGIIVSNHGGRQLDGAISAISALRDVVEAAPTIPVMFDSGVRRGTDVLKAMSLGARFVFAGRPFNYAASVAAEPGVLRCLQLLKDEILRDMAMVGVNTLDELAANRHEILRHTPNG